jgi:2-haloacid dehalogenase
MKIIAFDVFNTVFDLAGVPRDEIKAYADHIRQPEWSPLVLPKSWETLPAHPDSQSGIARLREKFMVVTMSNGPLGLLSKVSKHNGISWDAIIPLEMKKVFKPNPAAYMTICEVFGVNPSDVVMVTANEHFGDIEASRSLGMRPVLIRGEYCKDINALANLFC